MTELGNKESTLSLVLDIVLQLFISKHKKITVCSNELLFYLLNAFCYLLLSMPIF